MKGFRSSHPPFPSFAWRTHIPRRQLRHQRISAVGVSDRRAIRLWPSIRKTVDICTCCNRAEFLRYFDPNLASRPTRLFLAVHIDSGMNAVGKDSCARDKSSPVACSAAAVAFRQSECSEHGRCPD
jgi:hypothetical protein